MAYLQFIFVVLFGRLSQAREIPGMNSPCNLFVFWRDENKERLDEFIHCVDLAFRQTSQDKHLPEKKLDNFSFEVVDCMRRLC